MNAGSNKPGVIALTGGSPGSEPAKGVPPNEELETGAQLEELASVPRRKLQASIAKARKLINNLQGDLERHGEAERWKRYGDLILANVSNASREGSRIMVTDYFDEAAPVIEIEGDENKPLAEIAEGYFRRYTKARNAARVVADRMVEAEQAINAAKEKLRRLNAAVESGDAGYLLSLTAKPAQPVFISRKKKIDTEFKGARRFMSSDGFEILVGKKAKDNDFLTFRVARSLDTWMHAADYPGSHVVIRNQNRKEIPNQTLLEAAQLAAFYSDARESPKAAVNYTLKKFVNKPKRSAPGLVSLASFKTLLVEPGVNVEKM